MVSGLPHSHLRDDKYLSVNYFTTTRIDVAQTSKSAVSRASKPAPAARIHPLPIWKSAARQVWKPAPQAGRIPLKTSSNLLGERGRLARRFRPLAESIQLEMHSAGRRLPRPGRSRSPIPSGKSRMENSSAASSIVYLRISSKLNRPAPTPKSRSSAICGGRCRKRTSRPGEAGGRDAGRGGW